MQQSEGPLFSIITVCLNAEDHITEALRSVADQHHGSFELVVVDGGSTDGTLDLIRGFESEFGARMRWTSEPDSGLYDAMNKGLLVARGRYVVFLGADDRLMSDALGIVERALREHEWPDIVAGSVRVFGGTTDWVERPRSYASRSTPKRAPVRHQSIFVSREALLEVGGFETRYRIAADYELYLRLVESGVREILVPDTLSEFRLGGVSSTSALRTAREYRDVRVAHGGNRLWQHLVMVKSVLAATLVGAMRRVGRSRATATRSLGRTRVLVVSLGRFGGVTEYGWLMGKALAGQADIAVVYSSSAENRDKWKTLYVPQLEIDTFSGIAGMLLSLFSVRRFARIRRFAREFGPDVVYYPGGHAWKPVLDFVLPRAARTVLTIHDPDLHPGEDSLMHRAFDAANRRKADGYVLLNRGQSRTFAERHGIDPDRVAVIPHGVFEDFPDEFPALSDVDDLAPIAQHVGRYLLFIGRIRRYKGIDALLAAYRDGVADEVPLVVAGSGEFSAEERALLDELRDRPVFVVNRWLEPEDVSALVSGARFVVLPYTSATQSGVIPLASAFGVPSIGSDTGGIAEQLLDGETGFLFPAGESATLATVIGRAISLDDTEYAAMSARCKEYAQANWAWDGLAGQLLGFFESLRSGE